ncbi:MAG: asparaginase [Firmicutes bacterium]|nr:asparaginase [Bacillota bacterium]
MDKKHVHILATGGTIAGMADSPIDLLGYTAGAASIRELLDSIPEINMLAELQTETFCGIASENGSPELWISIAHRAAEVLADPAVDALVVTSGTDTLEEMSYFLDIVLDDSKPVVVVGAMRPFTAYSPDGTVNLHNAVAVATAEESAGKGVLVVMNDTIMTARGVSKADSFRVNTMTGGEFGTLGWVAAGDVHYGGLPLRRSRKDANIDLAAITRPEKVEIFYMAGGADARLMHYMAELGAKGVVLAGFGSGTFSDAVRSEIEKLLQRGVTVVLTSRARSGLVHSSLPGLIEAGDLTPQQARVLLIAALSAGMDREKVKRCFEIY